MPKNLLNSRFFKIVKYLLNFLIFFTHFRFCATHPLSGANPTEMPPKAKKCHNSIQYARCEWTIDEKFGLHVGSDEIEPYNRPSDDTEGIRVGQITSLTFSQRRKGPDSEYQYKILVVCLDGDSMVELITVKRFRPDWEGTHDALTVIDTAEKLELVAGQCTMYCNWCKN